MSPIDRAKLLRDRGRIDCINCGGEIAKADERCAMAADRSRACSTSPGSPTRSTRSSTIEPHAVHRPAARQGALQCAALRRGAAPRRDDQLRAVRRHARDHQPGRGPRPGRGARAGPARGRARGLLPRSSSVVSMRSTRTCRAGASGWRRCRPRPTRSVAAASTSPTGIRPPGAGDPCLPSSRSPSCSGSDGTPAGTEAFAARPAPMRSQQRRARPATACWRGRRAVTRHPLRARRDRALGHARLARRGARSRAAVPAHRPGARRRQRAVVAVWRANGAFPTSTLLLGVYGLFGFHFLLFVALRTAPPLEANLVNYLWPLLIVVLAPVFLRGVKLRPVHVLAAIAGFAGAALAIARRPRRERRRWPGATSPPPARRSSGQATRFSLSASRTSRRQRSACSGWSRGCSRSSVTRCSSRRSRSRRATCC